MELKSDEKGSKAVQQGHQRGPLRRGCLYLNLLDEMESPETRVGAAEMQVQRPEQKESCESQKQKGC